MTRLFTPQKPSNKTVSLVLGSGGARGIAHIGVIQCLEEFGYQITSISGCSMGAVVGGIYAAGKLKTYELWLRKLTRGQVISLMDFSFNRGGLVKGNKVIKTMIELVGNHPIEELAIPYTAVATDILQFKEVWIQKGPLFKAIRASMSLPLLMTPYAHHESLLVDGGVLNPVPIAPLFSEPSDMTIAVNLCGPNDPYLEPSAPDKIQKFQLFDFFIKKPGTSHPLDELGFYDITTRAFEAMQTSIARQKLAAYPPDLVIELPRNTCKTLEFYRANELIDIGYQKTFKFLNNLKNFY
ncbi:MAG: patatin-like phospholipase family protein [Cellvibrionales bacterium]|nr:patatin-like phospholipase family protein [Cellvibrionales bacterium]